MFSQFASPGHGGEVKTQNVIAAAQDPQSSVSADDAKRVMMEEAQKAGAGAYTFDPNASPDEKAAVAAANIPADFHHQKHAGGVAVVSDIDDGTPDQYNLPPPTMDGAVALPASPTTTGLNGSAVGRIHQGEKADWEKKVGWAPRFGVTTMTEAENNESALDHTTFLESKLEDKFFGDWYHNAAVIVFACIASWLVALLGGGIGWVFIVMGFCGTYYRTSIRRVRRNFRDDVSREMAKTKLETDTESLEWINSFVVKFWPIYAPVLCETIVASVDQVLSVSTPAFLESLRLSFFTLGTKPPRLDHVKTYPKAEDNIVLMDWKFSFTPGDRMDMTARQLKEKINPKVVLGVRVGVGIVSKELDVIVEDFAFSGTMRVKVKLQIPYPHVEKVEISFLGKPEIDYVCKPIGGDMLGFDINFVPGLSSFITDQIHGNLAPMMYDPNVFPIEIAKMLAGSAVDKAIGVVAVTLHGAQGLKNPDLGSGLPDPYCQLSLNGREKVGKSKTIKQTTSPRWNETFYIIVTSLTDTLNMDLFDWNEFRKHKAMGTAAFAMEKLDGVDQHDNLQLEVSANGKARGIIQADVRFFPVLEPLKLEDGKSQPPPETNTGIARFAIEQAKDLDGTKSMVGLLNPYAALLLNGHEIHASKALKRTNQPVWPDAHKEFLITNRKTARLGLVVKDERGMSADPVLGAYQIKLDDLMQMMDQGKEWFNLSGTTQGRVKLNLEWKPVALTGAVPGSGGYVSPVGVMRLHFQSARNLRNVETVGKSDPYVRVQLSGVDKGKTVTFQNNLNPDWDEVVYVPVHSPRERLILEVMDYQNIGKDRSLGLVELAAAEYMLENDSGEFAVHDEKKPMSEPLRMHGKGVAKGTLNFTAAFYPTLAVVDPEEEAAEKEAAQQDEETAKAEATAGGSKDASGHARSSSKVSNHPERKSLEGKSEQSVPKSAADDSVVVIDANQRTAGKIDTNLAQTLKTAEKEQTGDDEIKSVPKIRLSPEDLSKHVSGLLIFKLLSGEFAKTNVYLEVVMDDMAFASYTSSKIVSKHTEFGETGDAMVRELDLSRISLRLVEKVDKKGSDGEEHVVAKLVGDTLATLQRCLYTPTDLILKSTDGSTNKITVSLRYLPIKMHLDPSESMNNMGTLRVDLLDAADLPSADRNGYSDPYCKFELNGETVYKSKVQKKTLHPAWNEFFETSISSRTAAKFMVKVLDWDLAGEPDFLGAAMINLEMLEPMQSQEHSLILDGKSGVLRLRLLFKSAYVTRSRQGSSTFSGTIGPAGKVIGAPVKGVTKVGGVVGGGVVRGATFLRHGFRSSKESNGSRDMSNGSAPRPAANGDVFDPSTPIPSIETPPATGVAENGPSTANTPTGPGLHARNFSFGSKSGNGGNNSMSPGALSTTPNGTASFAILSATGFPPAAKVQVHVKQLMGKQTKELHKTRAIRAVAGGADAGPAAVTWEHETFRASCTPDAAFVVSVRDDKMFGGDDLGEAMYFVADSETGAEKAVAVGQGSVLMRSSFKHGAAATAAGGLVVGGEAPSPKDGAKTSSRRSFLSKRDSGSRAGTPS